MVNFTDQCSERSPVTLVSEILSYNMVTVQTSGGNELRGATIREKCLPLRISVGGHSASNIIIVLLATAVCPLEHSLLVVRVIFEK